MAWWYHRLCSEAAHGNSLGKLVRAAGLAPCPGVPSDVLCTFQMSVATFPRGAGLGGYAQQLDETANLLSGQAGHKMCSTAAGHLWPCFPEWQDWKLCLTVE